MPITVKVSLPITNRWCKGRCKGFQHMKNDSIVGFFQIFETNQSVSKNFGKAGSISLNDLNQLRNACGMDNITQVDTIELPKVGDNNMMGYDRIIEIHSVKSGNYINAGEFRGARTSQEQQPKKNDHGW